MADLREAMRLISGDEVSPESVQRVMAIAHALDIPKSDAMLPILVALDSYRETLSGTAAAAVQAMQRAASHLTIAAVVALAAIIGATAGVWARHDALGTDPAPTRWATSLAGRTAYAFVQANPKHAVSLLTACDLPTWHRVIVHGRAACEVAPGRNGNVYGWYLPEATK